MNATWFLIVGIAIGIAVGITIGLLLRSAQATNNQKIIDQAREAFNSQAAASFKSLSMDALTPVTNQLATVASSKLAEQQTQAAQDLEKKKALIDQTLVTMNVELSKVQSTMQELKEKGESQFGGLTQQLADASLQTSKLTDITTRLKEALASGKTRGLWGERMADDILRAAGFKEGVNYLKQEEELSGNRPDFTFLLPKNLRLNMDVKFPLDNYMGVISGTTDEERASYTKKFLSDVQQRVKEINSRGYIDPGNGTNGGLRPALHSDRIGVRFCTGAGPRASRHCPEPTCHPVLAVNVIRCPCRHSPGNGYVCHSTERWPNPDKVRRVR